MSSHKEKATSVFKALPQIVATAAAAIMIISWMGGSFQWPGQRFDSHVAASNQEHVRLQQQKDSAILALKAEVLRLEQEIESGHRLDSLNSAMLEGIAIGECLENDIDGVNQRRLMRVCRSVGIEPRPAVREPTP